MQWDNLFIRKLELFFQILFSSIDHRIKFSNLKSLHPTYSIVVTHSPAVQRSWEKSDTRQIRAEIFPFIFFYFFKEIPQNLKSEWNFWPEYRYKGCLRNYEFGVLAFGFSVLLKVRAGRIALWNRSSLLSEPAFWERWRSIRKRAKSDERTDKIKFWVVRSWAI